jgi:hypothetical protein
LVASRGRRARRCVRSTFALRNRSNSSTRTSSLPSAMADPHDALRHLTRTILVPKPCGSVLVPANVSLRVPCSPVRGRALTRTGQLGANRYERGWGETRFTTGLSLRRPAGALERRRFFLCEKPDTDRLWHPCRLLLPARPGSRFLEHRALVGRPPRPVPRGPRERRALLRSRMPSIGSRRAQRARAEARTNPRSLLRDDGAHVMRIAAPRKTTLLLPDGDLERLHARESSPVRLPFTRSWSPAWLSTIPA